MFFCRQLPSSCRAGASSCVPRPAGSPPRASGWGDVRVPHRPHDGAVTEQLLHVSQGHPQLDEVAGEGVPQRVHGQRLRQPRLLADAGDQPLRVVVMQGRPVIVEGDVRLLQVPVGCEGSDDLPGQSALTSQTAAGGAFCRGAAAQCHGDGDAGEAASLSRRGQRNRREAPVRSCRSWVSGPWGWSSGPWLPRALGRS